MDDLISRKAAMDCCFKPQVRPNAEIFNALKMAIRSEISAIQSIPAVPLDKLCELLAANADCPPEHNPIIDHCKENKCVECWKTVLKEWVEE